MRLGRGHGRTTRRQEAGWAPAWRLDCIWKPGRRGWGPHLIVRLVNVVRLAIVEGHPGCRWKNGGKLSLKAGTWDGVRDVREVESTGLWVCGVGVSVMGG